MSSSKNLTQRIETTQNDLKKLRRGLQRGTWLMVIVGSLLLALVAGYFWYGYQEISALKDPELIVSLVGNAVDQQIPQVRRTVEQQVDDNAAIWAEQASQQVLASAPTVRQGIETLAAERTDVIIDQLDVIGEEKFRAFLKDHRDTVEQVIEDVKEEKEVSDGVLLLLEDELQKELNMSMDEQAATLLTILGDLNTSLELLNNGEGLSPEQERERRVLMIARRLHKELFGDVRFEGLSAPVVSDFVEDLERQRLKKQAAATPAPGGSDDDGAEKPEGEPSESSP